MTEQINLKERARVTTVSRRRVAAGAAWAVPTVVAASHVKAYAASDINEVRGLNGWVTVSKNCDTNPTRLTIDGRGSFTGGGGNDRGLWVFASDSTPAGKPTNAFIVFSLTSAVSIFWSSLGGGGWTTPSVFNGSPPPAQAGFTRYRMAYSGDWTYNPVYGAWVATGQPYFGGTTSTNACPTFSITAYRSVVVSGATYAFSRTISL